MRGRLLMFLLAVVLVLLLAPFLALVLLTDFDQPAWVVVAGAQLLAFAIFARGVLLSQRPSREPERWVSRTRWWRLGSAGAVVVATGVIVIGLFLQLSPLLAAAIGLVATVAVAAVARQVDRYAARVAREDPPDVEHPADGETLEPARLRAALRRRLGLSVGIGLLVGMIATTTAGFLGRPTGEVVLAAVLPLGLACFASSTTLFPMQLAAGRRLTAFASAHPSESVKAARRAVLKGRVESLDPDGSDLAVDWARAAQPALLLQLVTTGPLWTGLLLTLGLRTIDGAPLSFVVPVVASALFAGIAVPMSVVQYRRVRRVAAQQA